MDVITLIAHWRAVVGAYSARAWCRFYSGKCRWLGSPAGASGCGVVDVGPGPQPGRAGLSEPAGYAVGISLVLGPDELGIGFYGPADMIALGRTRGCLPDHDGRVRVLMRGRSSSSQGRTTRTAMAFRSPTTRLLIAVRWWIGYALPAAHLVRWWYSNGRRMRCGGATKEAALLLLGLASSARAREYTLHRVVAFVAATRRSAPRPSSADHEGTAGPGWGSSTAPASG